MLQSNYINIYIYIYIYYNLYLYICIECDCSCEQVANICLWRLKETTENIILLTLILTDSLLKNCEHTFSRTITKVFMDEVVYIAIAANKGYKAAEVAQK